MTSQSRSESNYTEAAVHAMDSSPRRQIEAAENEGMQGSDPTPSRTTRASETSSLERRVLAHERILQTLIAHMAETEPRFLERLEKVFSEPLKMVRREHDFTSTDDYAEAFVRTVIELGEQNLAATVRAGTRRVASNIPTSG